MFLNKLFSEYIRPKYDPNSMISDYVYFINLLLTMAYVLVFAFLLFIAYKIFELPENSGMGGFVYFVFGFYISIGSLVAFFIQCLLALTKFKLPFILCVFVIPVILFYLLYPLWEETFVISTFAIGLWILFCSFSFLLTKKPIQKNIGVFLNYYLPSYNQKRRN